MRSPLLIAAVIGSLWSSPGFAGDPGTAEGTMTSDGIAVPFAHAYALDYGNEEGMLDGPELRVLLTDREVPAEVLSGPILDRLDRLARTGVVRGIVLRFDEKQLANAPVNGTVLLAPPDPETSLTFITLSPGEGIQSLDVSDTRVAGKLAITVTGDTPTESVTAQVTFSAPKLIDAITARLSGTDAAQSPPVEALVRWNDALRKGDFEQLRSLSSDEKYQEVESFRNEVGEEAFRKVVETDVTSGADVRHQVKEVLIRGDRAFIIIDDDEERDVATASRRGDRWIVD